MTDLVTAGQKQACATDRGADYSPLVTSSGGRTLRRGTRALVIMATLVVALAGGQGAAHASQGNYDFDAYCNSNHTITAWAPDLTHDGSEWTVVWTPTLYRYDSGVWVDFKTGPTQIEGQGGDDLNWWIVQNFAFSDLPQGYYQVGVRYSWLHNGVSTGADATNQAVGHKLDGVSYYYGSSVATLQYSTPTYCYEG